MNYVLVTGAAGGLGNTLVKKLSFYGYSVIATDLLDCPADLHCDNYIMSDLERVANDESYAEDLINQIKTIIGNNGLSALINNAAVQILGGVETLDSSDWLKTLSINVISPFLLSKAFLCDLEIKSGTILNISSIHARLTKSGFVAYATSKAALSGLTRSMAVDLGGRVTVNALEIAALNTEMLLSGFGYDYEMLKKLEKYHPVGEIGDVDQIASYILSIIESRCKFLSGSCIAIDGAIGSRLFDPS